MFTMFILMMSVALLFGAAVIYDDKIGIKKRTKKYLKTQKILNEATKRY